MPLTIVLATDSNSRSTIVSVEELTDSFLKDEPILKTCPFAELSENLKGANIVICGVRVFSNAPRENKLELIEAVNNAESKPWFIVDSNDSIDKKKVEHMGIKWFIDVKTLEPNAYLQWKVACAQIIAAYMVLNNDERALYAGFDHSNMI